MADFELLAPGGHQELVDEVLDRLDTKADYDGYYAQLTAGAADNLTGRGDGVSASYLYRTTGGDTDVADGTATVKSIHGSTVRWNQLARYGSMSGNSSTITTSGNTATVTSINTSGIYFGVNVVPSTRHTVVAGHKYLVVADVDITGITDDTLSQVMVSFGSLTATFVGTHALTESGRIACIATTNATGTGSSTYINAVFSSARDTSGQSFTVTNAMVMDLTAMFGAGNEPSTVAEFEALYPLPYYEYDAGSLLSVQMEGIETVGFNQWDGTFSLTNKYIKDTGAEVNDTDSNVTSYIPAIGGQSYYVKGLTGSALAVCWYDANKEYIGGIKNYNLILMNPANVITLPSNACYIRSSVDKTKIAEFCINLSWSGYRNGEYEPYWSSQREIAAATYFPDGMRSAGSVYDELTSTEAITRVGSVDLGTLTWAKTSTTNPHWRFYAYATSIGMAAGTNMTCQKYDTITTTQQWQGVQGIASQISDGSVLVMVSDEAYTDIAAFKTAMSGVMLHYALATPTVTPIDPPLNLSYRVSDFGTERVMHTAPSAPPTMQVVYGLNVVDTVRRLPTEYISHDSFTQFTNALATFLGATITESWDATDNRYEYAITQNGE